MGGMVGRDAPPQSRDSPPSSRSVPHPKFFNTPHGHICILPPQKKLKIRILIIGKNQLKGKIFWVSKKYRSNLFFVPKIYGTIFWSKKYWSQKIEVSKKLGSKSFVKIGPVTAEKVLIWTNGYNPGVPVTDCDRSLRLCDQSQTM